ncbi:MAG: hypothetical protein HEP71_15735 [Roseivirga sp.]|nr:hypothetical protein [Roseivirga sp.]
MSNMQSVVITPGAASRNTLYLNVFSFFAQDAQEVKVSCSQIGYEGSFVKEAGSENNIRFGEASIDISQHKTRELTFEVEINHNNGEPSKVNAPIYCEAGGHLHVSVDSEDGTDNDFDDAVVFFDLFTPVSAG